MKWRNKIETKHSYRVTAKRLCSDSIIFCLSCHAQNIRLIAIMKSIRLNVLMVLNGIGILYFEIQINTN